jgi:hypothetical protein
MKNTCPHYFYLFAGMAVAFGASALCGQTPNRRSAAVVITPPAVHDGSNRSRAPFPAARQFDDVQRPNGQAVDQNVPPNTPSTNPDNIAPPAPVVAILQPRVAPGLMPTGRPTIGAAASLDAANVEAALRSSSVETRDRVLDDLEVRVRAAEQATTQMRHSMSEMSESGRTQFTAASEDIKAKERALRKSIRRAHDASAANWDAARDQLAADYQAYASALSQIDAAAGIAPAPAR